MTRAGCRLFQTADRNRHATLWRNSLLSDLGTLCADQTAVSHERGKNTAGIIVGYSQTADWSHWGGFGVARFTVRLTTSANQPRVRLGKQPDEGLPNFPGGNNALPQELTIWVRLWGGGEWCS